MWAIYIEIGCNKLDQKSVQNNTYVKIKQNIYVSIRHDLKWHNSKENAFKIATKSLRK